MNPKNGLDAGQSRARFIRQRGAPYNASHDILLDIP